MFDDATGFQLSLERQSKKFAKRIQVVLPVPGTNAEKSAVTLYGS